MKRKSIAVLLIFILVAAIAVVVSTLFGSTYEPLIEETPSEPPTQIDSCEVITNAPARVPVKQLDRPSHWPDYLQDYVPGSIRLIECLESFFVGPSENFQQRAIFYQIDGFIIDLVSHEEWVVFQEAILVRGNFDVMPLVQFIQHFDISRETMEVAIAQLSEARASVINMHKEMMLEAQLEAQAFEEMTLGHSEIVHDERDYTSWPWYDPWADPMHEINEIPNLDIIFTFDNDIINWFYRRA